MYIEKVTKESVLNTYRDVLISEVSFNKGIPLYCLYHFLFTGVVPLVAYSMSDDRHSLTYS